MDTQFVTQIQHHGQNGNFGVSNRVNLVIPLHSSHFLCLSPSSLPDIFRLLHFTTTPSFLTTTTTTAFVSHNHHRSHRTLHPNHHLCTRQLPPPPSVRLASAPSVFVTTIILATTPLYRPHHRRHRPPTPSDLSIPSTISHHRLRHPLVTIVSVIHHYHRPWCLF